MSTQTINSRIEKKIDSILLHLERRKDTTKWLAVYIVVGYVVLRVIEHKLLGWLF